jgi:hypothetical protein
MKLLMFIKRRYFFIGRLWQFILISVVLSSVFQANLYLLDAATMDVANTISGKKKTTDDQKKEAVAKAMAMIFKEGQLTVRITSTPLKHVMDELGRLTGVTISWLHPDTDQRISAGFANLPLHEAVQHILYGESYVLSYASTEEGETLSEILIVSESKSGEEPEWTAQTEHNVEMFKPDMEQWKEIKEQHALESANDEAERMIQIENIFTENREAVLEDLTLAVSDNSEISGLTAELRYELSNTIDNEHNGMDPIFLPSETIENLVRNLGMN